MIEFWIICALLLVVAVMFVALPLWRGVAKNNAVAREAANLEILRDQAAEMEKDLANGLLTPEQYEQGKRELEARLLEEVKPASSGATGMGHPLRLLAISLVVLIPAVSVALYWNLGDRNALLPQDQQAVTEGFGQVVTGEGLKKLDEKLKRDPNDVKGWLVLAQSYAQLGDYKEAVRAYGNLTRLAPKEARYWADYADAYAMTQGQSLRGKPTDFLVHALTLDPTDEKALALAGTAAMEVRDYASAVKYWSRLYQEMSAQEQNGEMGRALAGGLAQARAMLAGGKGGGAQGVAPGKERITGTVTLAANVKAQAAPDDTVYVLARAVDGPRMPLAVIREQVKDLPLKFRLDDSMAMPQGMKLSDFSRVVVVARISKSGNAMPQPGDLQGTSDVVKPGAKGIRVKIDQVVK